MSSALRWRVLLGGGGAAVLTLIAEPAKDLEPDSGNFEACRKFGMWRASTANFLLETQIPTEADGAQRCRDWSQKKAVEICQQLHPFTDSKHEPLVEQLSAQICEALTLDKRLNRQAATIRWFSLNRNESDRFDPKDMEVYDSYGESDLVSLVLQPGLYKWGKSTGEDFNRKNGLLKAVVVCGKRRQKV